MSVLKLTKRSLDALRPAERACVAFDADLAGFGVRVMPSGSKSWIVEPKSIRSRMPGFATRSSDLIMSIKIAGSYISCVGNAGSWLSGDKFHH